MLKVGLTGGIGCGKSTAVDAFRHLGAPIIDADAIARNIVLPGEPALVEIQQLFGDKVIQENGQLDRSVLKEIVFSDPEALIQLENILHPRIRSIINREIIKIKNKPYVIVDVPLLVEQGYQSLFDRIIVVDCLPQQQVERVTARDNMPARTLQSIIQKQAGRVQRLRSATDILDNSQSIEKLIEQIKVLHQSFVSLS